MSDYTYDYEFINTYNGTRSPTGRVQFDKTTAYFYRALYDRLISLFEFNIPDGWNRNYFLNVLYNCGFIGIVNTPKYGIIPQICTFSGYGLYLQPTELIVSQPLVQFRGRIDDNCVLFKLTPDYRGVLDIVEHYAVQLSTCFTSISCSLVNGRLSFLAYAKSKEAAETLKVIAEKISAGEPMIVTDKIIRDGLEDKTEKLFTEAYDVAKNYITDKLLEDLKTIISQFDREIGIPVIDDKKERRIESELSLLTSDSGARCKVWERCLDDSIKRVNEVFPEINISYKYSEGRGNVNVSDSKVVNDRNV